MARAPWSELQSCAVERYRERRYKDGMNASVSDRVRTVTWEDPQVSRRDAAAITGFDYLVAIKDGRIPQPPAARLLGYRLSELESGRAVFELEPAEYHYNPCKWSLVQIQSPQP